MAKFCTKCGRALTEGEVCNCTLTFQQAPQQPVATTTTYVAAGAQGNSIVNECINIIKSFFKKPVDILQENINESKFTNAIVMIVLNGLAMGLFTIVFVKEVLGSMMSLFMGGLGSYTSLMGSGYAVEIPYFKYFIIVTLVTIAVHFLLSVVTFLVSDKMFKGNTSFKKMVALFGFSSIILTTGLLVSSICLFVSAGIAIIVYALTCILNTYYLYKGIEFSCSTDRNKLGYVFVITYAIVMVIVYLITVIMG